MEVLREYYVKATWEWGTKSKFSSKQGKTKKNCFKVTGRMPAASTYICLLASRNVNKNNTEIH